MNITTSTNPNESLLRQLEDFVRQHPHGNFFQSPSGFHFFQGVENYQPFLITAQTDSQLSGSLLAVNIKESNGPKGFFSRRCIIFGGPLIRADDADPQATLLGLLQELNGNTKSIYTEFRNHFDVSGFQAAFRKEGYDFNPHLNFIVTVAEDAEKSMLLLNSSKRRQVRKSLKNGAGIRAAENMEDVTAFYAILKELYATKVKKPLPPFSFFEHFYKSPETGKYLLVTHDDAIIGGIMCPIYKDTIYEWYIGGLDGQIKNVYPSVLATWAPIEYAAQNGLKYFDFMGAGKPDEDYGVREFKSKFGGELKAFGRFVKINKPLFYSAAKAGLKTMQRLNTLGKSRTPS